MKAIGTAALLAFAGCGGSGEEEPTLEGRAATLFVDGASVTFENMYAVLEPFGEGTYTFEVTCKTAGETTFVVGFFAGTTDLTGLADMDGDIGYAELNPGKYYSDDIEMTWFDVGPNEYQPYTAEVAFSNITETEMTVELSGTWLEFASQDLETDEPSVGREVEVTGTFSVPVHKLAE